ncbi:MAG: NAD(P)-binding domain-containing protein, partial [Phycisphaerae bacterium]|nr:NAD(P)-binding domain-containing protein [Phycisphaerae bacterium]
MEKIKPTIGFIGAGVTGTALACQLWQHGYNVVAVNSRSISSAERLAAHVRNCTVCQTPQEVADSAQAVFITTPDDLIESVAAGLRWHPDQLIIHCSGV